MNQGTIHTPGDHTPKRAFDQVGESSAYTHLLLTDDILSDAQKRDTLASWASDKRAVADQPSLRLLDDGTVVSIDDILDALKSLDAPLNGAMPFRPWPTSGGPLRKALPRSLRWARWRKWRRFNDDDDDPPPCPAGIAQPFGPFPGGGSAGVLAEVARAAA